MPAPSLDPESEMGPLVTGEHLAKVKGYVDLGIEEGAELVVDGRELSIQGYENGFFMGGCLFDQVTDEMRIWKEEIFGPVLSVVRAPDFEEALRKCKFHVPQFADFVAYAVKLALGFKKHVRTITVWRSLQSEESNNLI